MRKIKLVTFDMAGTTVQDKHEVEHCFELAAQATGLSVNKEEILAAQGWSKIFVFETFWERQLGTRKDNWQEKVTHSYSTFKEILESHYSKADILPTKGTEDVFQFLREKNIKIALTTGFYRKVANIILDKLGWLEGLDANYVGNGQSIINMSITSDEVMKGRPEPMMIHKAMKTFNVTNSKEVINIGDTPSDIQSGKNADCLFSLAVGNGTHKPEQLTQYQPDFILKSLCELPDLIKNQQLI